MTGTLVGYEVGEDRQGTNSRGPVSQGMEFGFLILDVVRIHIDFK